MEIVDQAEDNEDPEPIKLEKYHKAREILDALDIPDWDK
jgi:hypothetical protein